MLRMVIVDDENIIRESLVHFIDWESINIEVVGTADNGSKALNIIMEQVPDIILTDISMPMLSGIEMIQMLRDKNIRSEVIFISAYNNFDYAKKAIEFGAFDYILKPINELQLIDTVKRCSDKIIHEKEVTHLLSNITNDKKQLLSDSLEKLFFHHTQLKPSEQKVLEANGITEDAFPMVIAAGITLSDEETLQLGQFELLLKGNHLIHTLRIKNNFLIYLLFSEEVDPSYLQKTFVDFFMNKKEFYMEQGIHDISMSNPYAFSKAFPRIATEVLLLHACGFNASTCFKIQIMNDLAEVQQRIPSGHILSQTKEAIENHDSDKLYKLTTAYFLHCVEDQTIYDLDIMKLKCIDFIDTVFNDLNTYQIANYFGEKHMTAKKSITSQISIDQIYEVTKNIFTNLSTLIQENKLKSSHHLVKLTMDYIHQNYNKNISLADISSKLYVSPAYLSMLFSRDVGEPFSRYVLNYRIQMAKTMLQNPKYKVYEIAAMTGFTDVAHFSKAFKQIEKKSPKQFMNS